MKLKNQLFRCVKQVSRYAYALMGTRSELELLGPLVVKPGPSIGALLASVFGILTAPCVVLADYYLLSAPVEYVASLTATGSAGYARYLVPVALAVVDVVVSLRRSLARFEADPHSYERPRSWNALIAAIIGIQVAAAAGQYIAIELSNPSPANLAVLGLLLLFAIAVHLATINFFGDGLLLLGAAISARIRTRKYRRLTTRLRTQTQRMLHHYQAFTDLSHRYQTEHPDEPPIALDPNVAAEINRVLSPAPTLSGPAEPPPGPIDPDGSNGPTGSSNPYQQYSDDDQRF